MGEDGAEPGSGAGAGEPGFDAGAQEPRRARDRSPAGRPPSPSSPAHEGTKPGRSDGEADQEPQKSAASEPSRIWIAYLLWLVSR